MAHSIVIVARKWQATHRSIVHVAEISSAVARQTFPIHSAGVTVVGWADNALEVLRVLRVSNRADVVAEVVSSEKIGSWICAVKILEDDKIIPHFDPVICRMR